MPESSVSGFADGYAERERLWHALGVLPARQRTVLVLRYYEDLADAEIAGLINAREATVRSLAARGLATLRQGDFAGTRDV